MDRRSPLVARVVLAAAAAWSLWAPAVLVAQPPQESPRRVEMLLYLIDLVEIASADQSFFADIVLEARWQDATLAGDPSAPRALDLEDVWNPELVVVNQRDVNRSLPEVVQVDGDGNVRYAQRFTGRFSAPMNLRDFPLDEQQVRFWVVAVHPREDVELVLDPAATVFRAERLSISDWDVENVWVESAEYRATPRARLLPGLALAVDVERQIEYYIIQVLIPLVAVVLMSWTVFWIDPAVVPTRMSVAVTTMLTLIAYRFMLGNLVPRLAYLTRLDYFMGGATALVLLTLFAMAATSYLKGRGHDATVKAIDRSGRLLFPLAFALLAVMVWLL